MGSLENAFFGFVIAVVLASVAVTLGLVYLVPVVWAFLKPWLHALTV
jgi:tetrahydromethanopterin S-methyltransferase subunit B